METVETSLKEDERLLQAVETLLHDGEPLLKDVEPLSMSKSENMM